MVAAFDVAGSIPLPFSVLWLAFVLRRICADDVHCWAAAGAAFEAVGQHLLATAWLGYGAAARGLSPLHAGAAGGARFARGSAPSAPPP